MQFIAHAVLKFSIMIYPCFLTMSADTPDESQVKFSFRVITYNF